jgi:hypothetical protein
MIPPSLFGNIESVTTAKESGVNTVGSRRISLWFRLGPSDGPDLVEAGECCTAHSRD